MSATSRVAILAEQRRLKATELRLSGLSYTAIGRRLGINKSTAQKGVRKVLNDLADNTREQGRELLALELSRLDAMQAAIWEQALSGDLDAVTGVLRIMAHRAKLTGLDKPEAIPMEDMRPTINVFTKGRDGDPDRLTWTNQPERFLK